MKSISDIIKETMPLRVKKKYNPVPWWTKECSKSIKARNRASNKLARCISAENLDIFLRKKAEAQKTLRQAERNYWQNFCRKLNRFMPESHIWSTIKRLNGIPAKKNKTMSILIENEKEIISDNDKTEVFGSFFQSKVK